MNALENFKKQVESYDHLKFNDAKNLYLKAINTKDAKESKELMDKLIMGTMNALVHYLEKSDLSLLENSNFDLDDVISISVEVWISSIYNGMLLNISSYAHIYDKVLSTNFANKLVNEEKTCDDLVGISHVDCIDLFYKFATLKEHTEFSESQRYELFYRMVERLNPNKNAYQLYVLFDNIYNNLGEKDVFDIPRQTLSAYLKAFIHNGLTDRLEKSMSYDGMEDMLANQEIYDLLHETLNNAEGISERCKFIIRERYGLKGEAKTLKEVGDELGVHRSRVNILELETLRKLRHPSRIKRLRGYFD